jgi:o-succinylbenzoate---CoA ligase
VLVDAWLPRAAARHPDRPAVNALTYAELLGEVDDTARRLAGRGVRAFDRVGLALPPGERFCIALHAILRLGAIAVPVDLRLGARERAGVVEGTTEVIDGAVIATPASEARLRDRHDLDAPAIVVHTSGTSGAPKAVELTYGNWLWSALGSAVALGLDPAERWLCALPLSHVGGLSIVMRSAIYATTAIVHERFDTDRVLDALMAEDAPTMVSLVPTTLERLLDAGLREPHALRWALLGGAPATTALQGRAAAAGVPVAPTYGLTEACSQVTTLGAPLFCTKVRMAPDGEILVSGPTVAPSAGPVLATGDLGE